MTGGGAARRWAAALGAWALPEALVAAAPSDPWRLDPARFAARADRAVGRATPGDAAALTALPRGGSVLDVGCGGGAASVPLVSRAGHCTGVDGQQAMLDVYVEQVARRRQVLPPQRGTTVDTVLGTWPDVAALAPAADVVVCHDVAYNVGDDIATFVTELTEHAGRHVVVVLPERHPLSWLAPYFEQLHGLGRPRNPTASVFVDVVRELGLRTEVVGWDEPVDRGDGSELVDLVAHRCGVGSDRSGEVEEALWRTPPPAFRAMVAVHWSPDA